MSLHNLFYPENIAVVGASPNIGGGKLPYYQVLLSLGYKGRIYPVNPAHKEINGVEVYPSLDDIPEPVDLAITSIPARLAPQTVAAAVRKNIKFVHFFTSGFSEVGNHELEKEMLELTAGTETRIVGPNCIGVHCTEARLSFDLAISQTSTGRVAFMGQSGGITSNFVRMCQTRHIPLNKAVSFGNQSDITAEEYLSYFGDDSTVDVICAYIEDLKDSRLFMDIARSIAKPVFILKGGTTRTGAKAAATHTGAISSKNEIFEAAMRQSGCVIVETLEELINVSMLSSSMRPPRGRRLGFLGAGGGTSVLFTDYAIRHGFELPELSPLTQSGIMEKISDVNTSPRNPVDLGTWGFDFNIMAYTIRQMALDEMIDIIIPYFSLDFISAFQSDQIEYGPHTIVDTIRRIDKPVIPIFARFTEDDLRNEETRIRIFEIFRQADLAVYTNIQDVISSIRSTAASLESRPEMKTIKTAVSGMNIS